MQASKPEIKSYRPDWERKCLTPADDGPGRVVLFEHVEAYEKGLLEWFESQLREAQS